MSASSRGAGTSAATSNSSAPAAEGSTADLEPLPLQRSPEFGPDTDFDALIREVLTRGPKGVQHCGSTSLTSTSLYMEDIGGKGRFDDVMDALEAREVGQSRGVMISGSPSDGGRSLEF